MAIRRSSLNRVLDKDELEKIMKSRGLGDTIESTIKKVTKNKLKPCKGCQKRRDALNRMFPYKNHDG